MNSGILKKPTVINEWWTVIKYFLSVLIFILSFSIAGCNQDSSKLEKEILEQDSSFQKQIDFRNSLRQQISKERNEYQNKIDEYDEQIEINKNKKEFIRKEYQSKIDKIKRQIEPQRREFERQISDFEREYDAKNKEIGYTDRDIKEIASLIDKKDTLSLTQEELSTWNDRLANLIRKKERLSSELNRIRSEIEITKNKIRIINL